jgi:hypothetical protein
MSDNVARNDRDAVIQVLARLPVDASLEDIKYEFEIIFDLLKDMRDGDDQETIPHEAMMAELRALIDDKRADKPSVVPAPFLARD